MGQVCMQFSNKRHDFRPNLEQNWNSITCLTSRLRLAFGNSFEGHSLNHPAACEPATVHTPKSKMESEPYLK